MDSTPKAPAASPVGSVDKALALVELLAEAGPEGLALRDVVERSGLNKPSAHRLLQALAHRGFADQDAAQRYRLGAKPVILVGRFLREDDLAALFRPVLVVLAQEVQELVHLGLLEGTGVLYLDKVEPDRSIRVWSRVGRQARALTTALGRAMVAAEGGGPDLLGAYAAGADEEVSARFRDAVTRARERGYASEQEENEAGISCVAVALHRPIGAPVAVSITGPSSRMTPARIEELGVLLRERLAATAPAGFSVSGPLPEPAGAPLDGTASEGSARAPGAR
ncbi:IclR family transcriptional regulator [Microbacterium betulae]|uniref:IclR family transcriptional regulator n=1 Tax=Microbacterium betulae TaxID=2981139 RepID=A0AA97I622_9MICO|nr:IclR family transcriptional regulator [Microbacterium sp. AB]WOF23354.1 IclR family transcriptional regulator [Microbacterium sp. AB]